MSSSDVNGTKEKIKKYILHFFQVWGLSRSVKVLFPDVILIIELA